MIFQAVMNNLQCWALARIHHAGHCIARMMLDELSSDVEVLTSFFGREYTVYLQTLCKLMSFERCDVVLIALLRQMERLDISDWVTKTLDVWCPWTCMLTWSLWVNFAQQFTRVVLQPCRAAVGSWSRFVSRRSLGVNPDRGLLGTMGGGPTCIWSQPGRKIPQYLRRRTLPRRMTMTQTQVTWWKLWKMQPTTRIMPTRSLSTRIMPTRSLSTRIMPTRMQWRRIVPLVPARLEPLEYSLGVDGIFFRFLDAWKNSREKALNMEKTVSCTELEFGCQFQIETTWPHVRKMFSCCFMKFTLYENILYALHFFKREHGRWVSVDM